MARRQPAHGTASTRPSQVSGRRSHATVAARAGGASLAQIRPAGFDKRQPRPSDTTNVGMRRCRRTAQSTSTSARCSTRRWDRRSGGCGAPGHPEEPCSRSSFWCSRPLPPARCTTRHGRRLTTTRSGRSPRAHEVGPRTSGPLSDRGSRCSATLGSQPIAAGSFFRRRPDVLWAVRRCQRSYTRWKSTPCRTGSGPASATGRPSAPRPRARSPNSPWPTSTATAPRPHTRAATCSSAAANSCRRGRN